ncbi:MAG: hypothetical protein SNJ52_01300, partial [Verrucomicrobiia bacterium]
MKTPTRIESPSGLAFEINANGSVRRMECGDIMLNLFLGTEMEGGPANIFLRLVSKGGEVESHPLIGPGSGGSHEFHERGFTTMGACRDVAFRARLTLATSETVWFWHVEIQNRGREVVTCDLIHTQDIGLAHYGAIRLNEFYVSQYIDHTPVEESSQGLMVASRQNQSMGGRHPWSLIGSLRRGVSYATDALQVYGLSMRGGGHPCALAEGLPGRRLQHEHSLVAIQDAPFDLGPGQTVQAGFCGIFRADNPEATQPRDGEMFLRALALPEATPPAWSGWVVGRRPARSIFTSTRCLEVCDLAEEEIDGLWSRERRHEERHEGELESFFCGRNGHVVLKAKELRGLRPHGHILRSGGALVPDEAALTSTVWMSGVFHSMVTQGHVSINRFLSTCHSYLSLFASHGQRVFIELKGAWFRLGVPSAFEMHPRECRWIYKHSKGLLEVVAKAAADQHLLDFTLRVVKGAPARFLITHHIAINGDNGSDARPALWKQSGEEIFITPIAESDVGRRFPEGAFVIRMREGWRARLGNDEMLFEDGLSRGQPFLCLMTELTRHVGLEMEGRLIPSEAPGDRARPTANHRELGGSLFLHPPERSPLASAVSRVGDILPWFVHNALVHYLSPRGLEQYSGGGWGTRDVCQGPVELLLALGHPEPIRDLLLRVFKQQNPDGDWPQWFMFYDRERNIRPGDSHGDIVYWPLLALAEYLSATGDAAFLEEPLPFFHPQGPEAAEHSTVWAHVERALGVIRRRVIPGTSLAAYGHGDWNDALQPAQPEMRDRLCSSWTVTLNYQTLVALAHALEIVGKDEVSHGLRGEADNVLSDFRHLLVAEGVVAGMVDFHAGKENEFLLHPRDRRTGLSYSLLPMIHAIINDMFTPGEAQAHLSLIRHHLLGPDGARLFDRPLAYRGGPQTLFQRAESASFFGREIGVMYTHAHLRYCEALARYGDAEAFFVALLRAIPIDVKSVVPPAAVRQSNCYYSSSDAAVADRYEASARYDEIIGGRIPLEGGWRIYSSGPGIAVRLIVQCFLGIRLGAESVVIDPVLPAELDALEADVDIFDRPIRIRYHVGTQGSGPLDVSLNGEEVVGAIARHLMATARMVLLWRDNHAFLI